jgi:hypothetical protein
MKNPFFLFLSGYLSAPPLMLGTSIIFGDAITAYIYLGTSAILIIVGIIFAYSQKK